MSKLWTMKRGKSSYDKLSVLFWKQMQTWLRSHLLSVCVCLSVCTLVFGCPAKALLNAIHYHAVSQSVASMFVQDNSVTRFVFASPPPPPTRNSTNHECLAAKALTKQLQQQQIKQKVSFYLHYLQLFSQTIFAIVLFCVVCLCPARYCPRAQNTQVVVVVES